MKLTSIFKYSVDKWWRPLFYLLFTGLLLIISVFIENIVFELIAFILFGLAYLIQFISFIYQLFKKRWLNSILSFFVLGAFFAISIFVVFTLFFLAIEMPDKFADNLKIPANIKIYNPVENDFNDKNSDSISKSPKTKIDLEIYSDFQPGIYTYEFWYPKIEKGTIYLKAFEITQNYLLSEERLSVSSAVDVYNASDTIMKLGPTNTFTIYEGDWGKPYATRFEVWFRSSSDKSERKLFEKNYKIEGWQR